MSKKNTNEIKTEVQLRGTLAKLLTDLTEGKIEGNQAGRAVAIANSIFTGVKTKMKYDQLRKKKEINSILFMGK